MNIPELTASDISRFWSKVQKAGPDMCWEWIGSKRRRGYGRMVISRSGKEINCVATRISYFIHTGINPGNKIILHSCDNPSCVNPNHLSPGTNKDNSIDMIRKKRGKRQFKNGVDHPASKLTEQNVKVIRAEASRGVTQKKIADQYNIDQSLVSRIVSRTYWPHI